MKNSFISSFKDSNQYKPKRIHFLGSLLIFIVSFSLLEGINRQFVLEKSESFLNLKMFLEKKDKIEVIFLGDSHFIDGINADHLGHNAFNLSFRAADYIQSYYILKEYIKDLPALRVVVLPVELHSFTSFRDNNTSENFFWNNFIDYHELQEVKGIQVLKNSLWQPTVLSDTFGRRFLAKNLVKTFLSKVSKYDIESVTGRKWANSVFEDETIALKKADSHFKDCDVFDQSLILYFRKILELCHRENILVVTMQMPVTASYLEYAEKYIDKVTIFNNIIDNNQYKEYIHNNLDFLELYYGKDDYFREDSDHLNLKGSKDFIVILDKELSKLI